MNDLSEIIKEASEYDEHYGTDSPCYYCDLEHPEKCSYCVHSKNRSGLESLQEQFEQRDNTIIQLRKDNDWANDIIDKSGEALEKAGIPATKDAPMIPDGIMKLKARNEKLELAVMVAVVQLYETYPDNVLKTFTLPELQDIVDKTNKLRPKQVEDIYKEALNQLNEVDDDTVDTVD